MKCPKCAAGNAKDSNFCKSCGHPLKEHHHPGLFFYSDDTRNMKAFRTLLILAFPVLGIALLPDISGLFLIPIGLLFSPKLEAERKTHYAVLSTKPIRIWLAALLLATSISASLAEQFLIPLSLVLLLTMVLLLLIKELFRWKEG